MVLVTVEEAGARLDVSARQIQRLARAGDLVLVGPNRIDWQSVLVHQAVHAGHTRRSWAEGTAWAAVALLAQVEAPWLGQAQRSRVKGQLRASTAEEVVARTRNRAVIHWLAGHRSAVSRIEAELVVSGRARQVGELTPSRRERADGYVGLDQYADLVSRYHLSEDSEVSNVMLRVTEFDLGTIGTIAAAGDVLAGLDLAASLDPRERSTGLAVLTKALARLK